MTTSVKDLHSCPLGASNYQFRTPNLYDPAKARRILTRQRVRRPSALEFQVAARAGVTAMAATVGDEAEGERQAGVLEEWYQLLEPTREDDIDEPDFEARAAELAQREIARRAGLQRLHADVAAIEANLERHWPPYAELVADRNYWDDISRIEVVRLLLVSIDGAPVPLDDDGLMTPTAYQALPKDHRVALATYAFGLMALDETQRKN